MIDDSGAARLEVHSVEDIDNYRYSAPETQFPKDRSESITPHTYSKDVYAMGMIVYEASTHRPAGGLGSMSNLTFFQVLTGSVPYSECDDVVTLSNIRAGKIPQRPSKGIPDPLWQLLEKCWSMNPLKRPSATQVYNALSESRSVHPVIEELPERLELRVQSIKISFIGAKKQRFFVRFKYGNERHTTSLTTGAAPGDEHAWFALCPSPSSLLSLNLRQGLSGNLVDRNGRTSSQPVGLLQSTLSDIYGNAQEEQGLCDRGVLRKSVTTARLPT